MSLGKNTRHNSILLPALPALQSLETSKQEAIFRMLGVAKDVRKEVAQLYKRLGIREKKGVGGHHTMMKLPTFWKKILAIDTQISREKALRIIDKMIKHALMRCLEPKISEKQRIEWVRTIGFLYQTWKGLAKDLDTFQVKAELEKLQKLVYNELEQRGRPPEAKH
jgi:hypothetical protein